MGSVVAVCSLQMIVLIFELSEVTVTGEVLYRDQWGEVGTETSLMSMTLC